MWKINFTFDKYSIINLIMGLILCFILNSVNFFLVLAIIVLCNYIVDYFCLKDFVVKEEVNSDEL
jgi:hypothetical protein